MMRIIIAIDIIGGRCVRLSRGEFSTARVYSGNPVEIARQIEDNGLKYIHLVDLDGALNKKVVNYRLLEKIASATNLEIDFGGGIRSDDDLRIAFESGAKQVTCGSIAVNNPALVLKWLEKHGAGKIILGADSKDRKIATEGWIENSDKDIKTFISAYMSKGMTYTICTDIDKDGMLNGPATELYKEIVEIPGIRLIASGGISTIDQLAELDAVGCEGAIIGKALYEGLLDLKELGKLC
ncbi:MAG TPA: 1-(5-phosphoribosyl)-5-[(5-phosphoribosylamino)methylideneamino]imidazole-4-carboxamide isomerase [Bacteroidales bacterium]|nr:1-(5-phosphoribosyl)-5-[(5-phosphoribosylamino)methylideneamino]imidazole-4-carboxamide isomerase [Bacteroidales bacterium]